MVPPPSAMSPGEKHGPAATPKTARFLVRLYGVLLLRPTTYANIAVGGGTVLQAAVVVTIVALATGVGAIGLAGEQANQDVGQTFVFGILGALFTWALWVVATAFLGVIAVRESAARPDLVRLIGTLSFAQAPAVFRAFSFNHEAAVVLFIATLLWQVAAMTVAVLQAFGYASAWRAFGLVIFGLVPVVVINIFVL
ncbi:MAG: hypothetical protein FJ312_04700 [SAR202 cluster bacterium]|nr:hypothetical protein [SAR202 cluster bacterium]